jgi:hypothetical protein
MDSIGAAGQGHVQTIVDHDARRGRVGDLDDVLHEIDELCRLETEFPDLNQIDAGAHASRARPARPRRTARSGASPEQPPPVGDETDRRAVKAHGGARDR